VLGFGNLMANARDNDNKARLSPDVCGAMASWPQALKAPHAPHAQGGQAFRAKFRSKRSALDTLSASDDHQPMAIQALIFGIHLARSTRGKPCAPPQA